jgi:hypothetical protein
MKPISIMFLSIFMLWMLAASSIAGSLEPTESPSPTMKSLDQVLGSWDRALPADDGPDKCHSSRFICVLTNTAVRDNETGLVWEKVPPFFGHWEEAQKYCTNLILGSRRGWRLPTLPEVLSLFIDTGLPPENPFTVVPGLSIWTATADIAVSVRAWSVLPTGRPIPIEKSSALMAWCVRGGSGNTQTS